METILCKSFLAGADLSAKQYTFVKLSNDSTVVTAGAGEGALGILQNNPESGDVANVMILGISRLVMSEAVAVMGKVASTAAGEGAAVTGDDLIYNAMVVQASTADNDEIKVLLCQGAPTISGSGDD